MHPASKVITHFNSRVILSVKQTAESKGIGMGMILPGIAFYFCEKKNGHRESPQRIRKLAARFNI
jgi:hypothetical protein